MTLVQGDRLAVVDAECLPLVTNGRRDAAVYRVTSEPTRGQLLSRDGGVVVEFTQRQVGPITKQTIEGTQRVQTYVRPPS